MGEYMDLEAGTIHWRDFGGSGPTLVLVHGLGGSIENWNLIAPRLAARSRVVALDLPGFGLSPPGRDWSLETHRDAVVEFASGFDSRVTLIGNSMGGLLSEMAASSHNDLVEALVLIAPATPPRLPDPRIDWPMAGQLLLGSLPMVGPAISRRIIDAMTPREFVIDSLGRITHDARRVPMDLVEDFVSLAERRRHLPWVADAVPKTGRSIRKLFQQPSRFVAMIREIRAPTLVVQGVADPIVSPTSVEWLCSLRPDWQLVQMEDTGHTPQIDAPVRFMGILEPWLETTLRTPASA